MTDDNQHHLGRVIDVLVYAPLGAGLAVIEGVPTLLESLAERGKSEVDRRREQIVHQATQAHSVGQFAWSFGLPKLRKRAQQRLSAAQRLAGQLAHSTGVGGAGNEPVTPAPRKRTATATTARPARRSKAPATVRSNGAREAAPAPSPPSADLPIPGYDALSASQVVERLAGLGAGELATVRTYESAHRNRRTILGKIEQLASPSV